MKTRKIMSFTMILLIIGFMLAIQFHSIQRKPVLRDTRDTWQLREALNKEMELQSRLIREIRSNEGKISEYESEREQGKEQTLRETLNELKEEAGLTEVTGPGVRIAIERIDEGLLLQHEEVTLSSTMLRRLLNELNMYGAKDVSIGGQRVINTTVIREIAGETKINGRSLRTFPLEIKVITPDFKSAKRLYNRMVVSKAVEEFFVDNLKVTIRQPEMKVEIPPYEDSIRIRNIESVKAVKGGS